MGQDKDCVLYQQIRFAKLSITNSCVKYFVHVKDIFDKGLKKDSQTSRDIIFQHLSFLFHSMVDISNDDLPRQHLGSDGNCILQGRAN